MKVTIIYHVAVLESSKEFYRQLSRQGVKLSVIVPRKVVIPQGYTRDNVLTFSENDQDTLFRFVPIDLIVSRNCNFGFVPWQLVRALRETKPDIIQVFNEYHCFPVTQTLWVRNHFLKKKVPVIIYGFQNMDYLKMRPKGLTENFKNYLRGFLVSYNMNHLNGAMLATTEAVNIVKEYNQHLQVKRLFWGVDPKIFYPKSRNDCRSKLGLPIDKRIIGYLGRMEKEKGLDDLLEAVARLKDITLLLIGNGNYLRALEEKVSQLQLTKRVILRRSVSPDQMCEYFNSLDCFVLASYTQKMWKEQFGRVLVEAMFCDVPIVGSSSGAIPEVLEGYARHLIFQERNVEDLETCIRHVLKVPSGEIDRTYLKNFESDHYVEEHLDFYETVQNT